MIWDGYSLDGVRFNCYEHSCISTTVVELSAYDTQNQKQTVVCGSGEVGVAKSIEGFGGDILCPDVAKLCGSDPAAGSPAPSSNGGDGMHDNHWASGSPAPSSNGSGMHDHSMDSPSPSLSLNFANAPSPSSDNNNDYINAPAPSSGGNMHDGHDPAAGSPSPSMSDGVTAPAPSSRGGAGQNPNTGNTGGCSHAGCCGTHTKFDWSLYQCVVDFSSMKPDTKDVEFNGGLQNGECDNNGK